MFILERERDEERQGHRLKGRRQKDRLKHREKYIQSERQRERD